MAFIDSFLMVLVIVFSLSNYSLSSIKNKIHFEGPNVAKIIFKKTEEA